MKKTRVVLADHEKIFRTGFKALLKDLPGIQVVAEVEQGPAAAEAVRDCRADLLITEMDLPYWNGAILTRQIRRSGLDTAVLLVTRNSEEQLVCDALAEGARGYILKSASLKELREAVQTVLDGGVYVHRKLPATLVRRDASEGEDGPVVHSRYDHLSPREREVLKLLVQGNRNLEVAELLGISVKTVEIHRARIMEKLDLRRLAHLVRYAIERNLIDTPKGTPRIHMPFTPRRGRPAGSKNRQQRAKGGAQTPRLAKSA